MAAYHVALQERTRERVPLDWAHTQNNMGGALVILVDASPDRNGLRRPLRPSVLHCRCGPARAALVIMPMRLADWPRLLKWFNRIGKWLQTILSILPTASRGRLRLSFMPECPDRLNIFSENQTNTRTPCPVTDTIAAILLCRKPSESTAFP